MQQATDELRVYFARVKPLCRELFGMAHAICGNYELAEYAMQRAILEGYHRNGRHKGRVGFRESLRGLLRRAAYEQTLLIDGVELTWNGFLEDAIDGAGDDLVLRLASQEGPDARRMLMLRYGCQMRPNEIARLTGGTPKQVRQSLDRFEKRLGRRLRPRERARVEAVIARSAREMLAKEPNAPDEGVVFRSFEAEAAQPEGRPHAASRILGWLFAAILALLCAAIFWAVAVLVESPSSRLETPTFNAALSAGEFSPVQTAEPTQAPFSAL